MWFNRKWSKKEVEKDKLNINWRYSPGYGNLDISIQRELLKSLDAERTIGLTASSHNILIPRKSVTAIIGVIPKEVVVNKNLVVSAINLVVVNLER